MVAVRLPNEANERLTNLATFTKRSKAFYIREAVLEYLDDLEDWYLAEQISINVNNGLEETFSHEEMKTRYGLED